MASIVTPDGWRQRALMVILAGPADQADQWDRWVDGNEADLVVFARLVPRGETADGSKGGVLLTEMLPAGPFFRGGYSGAVPVNREGGPDRPATVSRVAGQGRWWPWRRQ